MFLYNIGWRWGGFANAQPHGVIFNASGFDHPTAVRRDFKDDLPAFRLFDPQLYLSSLDAEECPRACARLASYPHTPVDVAEFNSEADTRKGYMDVLVEQIADYWPPALPENEPGIRTIIKDAIAFQRWFGVNRVILPMPLIDSIDVDIEELMQWVDIGHSVAEEEAEKWDGDAPPLATIAISDHVLARTPGSNPLLEAVIDQLTAREECRGIYIVPVQSHEPSDRIISVDVAQSLLHLCHLIGVVNEREVYLNFAEQLGFAALGAGATGFGSGYETKTQRCCPVDFVERGGGAAFPRFYSLVTTCDYLPDRDLLKKIARRRLLRILDDDETPACANLLTALRAPVAQRRLPTDWAETPNNYSSARTHYIQRITGAVDGLVGTGGWAARAAAVLEWLQEAERNAVYLGSRFANDQLSDSDRHVRAWRQAFENYCEEFDVL